MVAVVEMEIAVGALMEIVVAMMGKVVLTAVVMETVAAIIAVVTTVVAMIVIVMKGKVNPPSNHISKTNLNEKKYCQDLTSWRYFFLSFTRKK